MTDLLLAVVVALWFVKAGAALGGGLKAGVALGVFVVILSPVVGNLYEYDSVRYLPVGLMAAVSIFQVIAHAVEGWSRWPDLQNIGRTALVTHRN